MSRFTMWGQFTWGNANWTEWTPYGISQSGTSGRGNLKVERHVTGTSKSDSIGLGTFGVVQNLYGDSLNSSLGDGMLRILRYTSGNSFVCIIADGRLDPIRGMTGQSLVNTLDVIDWVLVMSARGDSHNDLDSYGDSGVIRGIWGPSTSEIVIDGLLTSVLMCSLVGIINAETYGQCKASVLVAAFGASHSLSRSDALIRLLSHVKSISEITVSDEGYLIVLVPCRGHSGNHCYGWSYLAYWASLLGLSDTQATSDALLSYETFFDGESKIVVLSVGDLTRVWEKEKPPPSAWRDEEGPSSIWTRLPMVATNWRER